jgi:transposase InsO family protein
LWCIDFTGEFKPGNGQYCYPLTVTDRACRYRLMCEAMESVREEPAFTTFEQLCRERGLPEAIRSDNGVPFASPQCSLQPLQAVCLLAEAWHQDRAHQTRQAAAKRPPRALASDAEEGSDPTARR